MKKASQGSYTKQFKEKIESKESKAKAAEGDSVKGINFDSLKDWDHIVYETNLNNQSVNNNNRELRAEDIYNPSLKQDSFVKAKLIHDEGEELASLSPKGRSNNNQFDVFNSDYSVNTSNFTYKQNDYDKIDLSTVNGDCNSNVIIGRRVPLAFCDNMVSQIKKGSPEHCGISPVVIKEEDEDDDHYKNEEDSLNGNDEEKGTDHLNNDLSNITQQQMNELDEEVNKMLSGMKVKAYEEKKGNGKVNVNKPKMKKNTGKGDKEEFSTQNGKKQIQQEAPLSNGQTTGKFGGIVSATMNSNTNVINNANVIPIAYPYQGYPVTYVQQCQQTGTFNIGPQMFQDVNSYPMPYSPNQPINSFPYQLPINISPIPMQPNPNVLYQPQSQGIQVVNSEFTSPETHKGKATQQYRPKTMKEYKQKYNDAPNKKMGGLGPNIGTKEWDKKQQKANKVKQYSSQIKDLNKEKPTTSSSVQVNNKIAKGNSNKAEEELKDLLLHDSLSDNEGSNNKSLEDLMGVNEDSQVKEKALSRPIQSAKITIESKKKHVNVIKSLKATKEQKQSQEMPLNYSNYKQVAVKPQQSPKHNKIYTTMKQPTIQQPRRNKSLDPARRQVNPRPQSSSSKPKTSTINHEDDLTQKFMQMPCNNLIENLLQNHQAYNTKVDKIRSYLNNK